MDRHIRPLLVIAHMPPLIPMPSLKHAADHSAGQGNVMALIRQSAPDPTAHANLRV